MNTHERWRPLAEAMRSQASMYAPEWTDTNAHDPGVTVLELCAYVIEELGREAGLLHSPDARRAAHRLTATVAALGARGRDGQPCERGLQRVNYFNGQRITAEDLRAEQDYFRARLRRLNLAAHGVGVVSGLQTSMSGEGSSSAVVVEPGLAVGPLGDEIELRERIFLPLPEDRETLCVLLRCIEQPCSPAPATEGEPPAHARIAEFGELALSPTEEAGALTLARLAREQGAWRVTPG